MRIPVATQVGLLFVLTMYLASCGDDPAPTATPPAVPAWAKVTPIHSGDTERLDLHRGGTATEYRAVAIHSRGTTQSLRLTLSPRGGARLEATMQVDCGAWVTSVAEGTWEARDKTIHLEMVDEEGRPLAVCAVPIGDDGRRLSLRSARRHRWFFLRPPRRDATSSKGDLLGWVLYRVDDVPDSGEEGQ